MLVSERCSERRLRRQPSCACPNAVSSPFPRGSLSSPVRLTDRRTKPPVTLPVPAGSHRGRPEGAQMTSSSTSVAEGLSARLSGTKELVHFGTELDENPRNRNT